MNNTRCWKDKLCLFKLSLCGVWSCSVCWGCFFSPDPSKRRARERKPKCPSFALCQACSASGTSGAQRVCSVGGQGIRDGKLDIADSDWTWGDQSQRNIHASSIKPQGYSNWKRWISCAGNNAELFGSRALQGTIFLITLLLSFACPLSPPHGFTGQLKKVYMHHFIGKKDGINPHSTKCVL